MNQPPPEILLQQQAAYARAARLQQQVERQESEAARSQFSGKIVQYDAPQGAYLVQLENGSLIFARSLTNSGAKNIGALVAVTKDRAGNAAIKFR